jgi:hypothetical protein
MKAVEMTGRGIFFFLFSLFCSAFKFVLTISTRTNGSHSFLWQSIPPSF